MGLHASGASGGSGPGGSSGGGGGGYSNDNSGGSVRDNVSGSGSGVGGSDNGMISNQPSSGGRDGRGVTDSRDDGGSPGTNADPPTANSINAPFSMQRGLEHILGRLPARFISTHLLIHSFTVYFIHHIHVLTLSQNTPITRYALLPRYTNTPLSQNT